MEAIKSALGYGTPTTQSGEEPASGETGKGTTGDPYDSGNTPGQSGAPAEGTSTNPAGTSQYDTEERSKVNSSAAQSSGALGDSSAGQAETQSTEDRTGGITGAAAKGDDESRGSDEAVKTGLAQTTSNDSNHNAQDSFFNNAQIDKDKPPAPPQVSSEPLQSSGDSAPSTTDQEQDPQPVTSSGTGESAPKIASTAPGKNYIAADTEPHPHSSEVLSSATPGAALDGPPPESKDRDSAGATGTDTAPGSQKAAQDTSEPETTGATTEDNPTAEDAAGLSGVPHDTSTPKAPDAGVPEATEDPGLGASVATEKPKMSQKIKEKLHIRKKDKS